MAQRRCHKCATFYDKKEHSCPNCQAEPHAFNKWLRTVQLNNHLYEQARG